MMLLSGLEMHVEMMVHRSVPAHTASKAAAKAKIERLSSIGIMNAGPWAVILIYTLANLLFCVGIHQSTISGATVEPILTMLIVDNMATFAAGGTIQPDHYMNMQIVNSFALIGGSGCTLMLLLDTLLFSKNKASKTVSKMAILPGLFNINEPVIYGYPIVYNLPLMIPFVLLPDLFIGITYGLTCAGIISPCIAQVPWTMPPVINALLATGFDWRAGVWQALELVIGMAVYLPFMRITAQGPAFMMLLSGLEMQVEMIVPLSGI